MAAFEGMDLWGNAEPLHDLSLMLQFFGCDKLVLCAVNQIYRYTFKSRFD